MRTGPSRFARERECSSQSGKMCRRLPAGGFGGVPQIFKIPQEWGI
jgi:hypothetical protein